MNKGWVILFYPLSEGDGVYHWFPFPYIYIAPFLEQAGFDAYIIDARVSGDWRELLRNAMRDALCLGITAMTGTDIKCAIEAVKIAREVNLSAPIIWGGPHATALPKETADSPYVDIVVSGQGEEVLTRIADRLCNGKDFYDIPSITYKKKGVICQNERSKNLSFDYDLFPSYDCLDLEKYRSPNNIVSAFTTRGCPFRCSFCATGDKGYSERAIEQVRKELLFLVRDSKFGSVFFQDGTFFISKVRVMQIARLIIEEGLNIKWKAKARVNSLLDYSDEELKILKDSGLVSVFFGVESGSERLLKNMVKKTTPQHAEQSAEFCRRYDLEFYVSFMFATPGETIEDLQATIAHIRKLKKINPKIIVQNGIYVPLPDTPMYEEARLCGYKPPRTLEGWVERKISSRFEERDDISWIPADILHEYINIYNDEFGCYKHLWEKERDGECNSVLKNDKK